MSGRVDRQPAGRGDGQGATGDVGHVQGVAGGGQGRPCAGDGQCVDGEPAGHDWARGVEQGRFTDVGPFGPGVCQDTVEGDRDGDVGTRGGQGGAGPVDDAGGAGVVAQVASAQVQGAVVVHGAIQEVPPGAVGCLGGQGAAVHQCRGQIPVSGRVDRQRAVVDGGDPYP